MGYGKITAKQQEILDYIKDEILKKGSPPTVREICETVHSYDIVVANILADVLINLTPVIMANLKPGGDRKSVV